MKEQKLVRLKTMKTVIVDKNFTDSDTNGQFTTDVINLHSMENLNDNLKKKKVEGVKLSDYYNLLKYSLGYWGFLILFFVCSLTAIA